MADSITFAGVTTSTPGVLTTTNDSALQPIAGGNGNVLCVMGYSTGGQPNTLLGPFASPADAKKVLVSGPLLTAVTKAFSPSTEIGAPSVIRAVNVGSATPGTLALNDLNGNQALTLTTKQYGVLANTARVMLLAGTAMGTMITVGYAGGKTVTQDNVGRPAFNVTYTGAAASATISVNMTTNFVTLMAPSGTTVGLFDLSVLQSIAGLVDAINTVSGFQATIAPQSVTSPAFSGLDPITNKSVLNTVVTVRADLQAQIDWFNNKSGLFSAVRYGNNAAVAPVAMTAATGATSPAPLLSDWVNAFVMLQGKQVNHIAVLSPNPAVWAAADAHVQYMSGKGASERRAYYGPDVGTTLSAVGALPAGVNSDRGAIVWPGYYDYDVNGVKTLYPSYMSAALVAAGFAALSPGQTMTNVSLNVLGLETQVNVPTDTDVLIPLGVCPLAVNSDGLPIVVRAISTWLQNNAFDKVEISTSCAVDYTNQAVRANLKQFLGSAGAQGQGVGPMTIQKAVTLSESVLNLCAKPFPAGPGVLVGDTTNPPWSGLTGSGSGDTISISYQASPVIPVNFITASGYLVPYSGTVTVALPSSGSLSGSTSTLS